MKELQLTEILKTFNNEELKSFRKFLSSPYNKSRRNLGILLDSIILFHPEFDSPKFSKEAVFKKTFPGEDFQEKKIKNFIFDLTEAAKDFLMINTLVLNKTDSQLYSCRGLYNKKLLSNCLKLLNKTESELVPGFSAGKDFFNRKRKILSMKIAYHLSNNDFVKMKKAQNEYYEISAIQFFIDYTWMRCADHTTSHTVFNKEKNEIIELITGSFDINKLLILSEKFDKNLLHLTKLHYYILKTVNEPKNKENYFSLKNLFFSEIDKFDREEKFQILSHMINFCGENIVDYSEDFAKEILEIYKIMLEHKAYSYSESEYLLFTDYRNILMLSVTYFDLEFIKILIKDHYKLLNPEYQKDVIPFSKSYLYFLEGNFEKCLEMIAEVERNDLGLKFDLRTLKLLAYYELDYTEQSYSLIDTYKHFIKNSKDANNARRETKKLMLEAYITLLKIRTEKDYDLIPRLNESVRKLNIWLQKWFKEKTDELLKFKK